MSGTNPAAPARSTAWRIGEVLRLLLVVGALAVFVVLWVHVAVAVLTDGTLLAGTWDWLTRLDPVATVVAWVALLPLGIFLWAWQGDVATWAMGLLIAGFVAWTLLALTGLRRR
jgi:hypothetical protein